MKECYHATMTNTVHNTYKQNTFKRQFFFNAVCRMSGVCVAFFFFNEKEENILTNPFDWIVKQRLVKQISSYKVWIFSTSIPVMNFKGTFKSTLSTLHIKLADRNPSLAQGWGEGAPLKESSGGRAVSICSDTYGFLAGLNTPDKSLPPKLSPTASAFLTRLFFSPATSCGI